MTGRTSRVLTYGANALLLLSLFLPTALETARPNEVVYGSVSYTHLTLPTIYSV